MDLNSVSSEVAMALIEKISSSIGVLYEPTNIKRLAKAKAQANKTKTLSRIEISGLEERALKRVLHEETKNQKNTESIIKSACENLDANANPSTMDEDWISHFFDKCKIVSNIKMQSIWTKLLATEANKPGSVSKKTIELVATLDKNDAKLFTDFCSFIVSDSEGKLFPLIIDTNNSIYTAMGVNFKLLNHLEDLGLIKLRPSTGFSFNIPTQKLILFYYDKRIKFTFENSSNNQFRTGVVVLTKSGNELALIAGAKSKDGFLEYIAEEFNKKNIKLEI